MPLRSGNVGIKGGTGKNQAELNLAKVTEKMGDSFSESYCREGRMWGHGVLGIGELMRMLLLQWQN